VISVRIGDLFESNAQALVNTVNLVGIMGKGIALEFKNRYPEMYKDYVTRCKRHEVKLGRPYIYRVKRAEQSMFDDDHQEQEGPEFILNFPTKDHWRSVSKLSDIVAGLEYLEMHYREWGITSIAVPPLGCGHGQLEWRVVGSTLYRYLNRLDIPVELYAPHGTPQEELDPVFLSKNGMKPSNASQEQELKINPAWIALAEIVARIEREPYHWAVGRTTFQKIAYFATEAGLPTGLNYVRGSYGPYAAEMKSLLAKLVNNGILTEEALGSGRMLAIKPGRTFHDAVNVFRSNLQEWEPIIDKISDLFLRMRTQQAEIAATVFFVARDLKKSKHEKPSEVDVLQEVMRWKQKRRPPLEDHEVARAIRNLNILQWVDVSPSTDLPLSEEVLQEA
jgi:O-acetyl-ADP-ribose deacetylase (regulator of RNase III)